MLLRAYASQLDAAREQHAQGVPVIAIVGNTVPAEYIHARGAMPLYLRPDPIVPTPRADRYIGSESWRMRSIVELALSGELAFARCLILTRGSEWIYYNLKEIVRLGEGSDLPRLYMHDYVPTLSDEAAEYNEGRNRALGEELDRVVGPASSEGWQRAAKLARQRHLLLSNLEQIRNGGRVLGSNALRAIGAGYALPAEPYLDELAQWTSSLQPSGISSRERVLLLSAHELDSPFIHEAIEGAGALVGAEDSWWGSRATGSLLPQSGDVREAVDQRLRRDLSGVIVSPRSVREQWVNERMARETFQTVVFYIPSSDLVFGWDYPKLKARAESLGLRTVLLSDRLDTEEGRASLRRNAETHFRRDRGGEHGS